MLWFWIGLLPLLIGFFAFEKIRAGNKKWRELVYIELLFFTLSILLIGTAPCEINYACTLVSFTSFGGMGLIFYSESKDNIKGDPVPIIFSILIVISAALAVWTRYCLIFV